MPFPSLIHRFQPGCAPGPGRPRRRDGRARGRPWLEAGEPGADLEGLAGVWARQVLQRQPRATRRFVGMLLAPQSRAESELVGLVCDRLNRAAPDGDGPGAIRLTIVDRRGGRPALELETKGGGAS